MALDENGKFLALRVHSDVNLGAYLATFGPAVPTILYGTLLAGQYTTPQIYVEVDGWFTNTVPVDAYRGARSEEHTSELQSLMRISYAVFCLKKKNKKTYTNTI